KGSISMPEQFITTRHYLHIDAGKYIYLPGATAEILSTWAVHLRTLGAVSITKLSNRVIPLTNVRGGTKLCLEMNTRIVCSDASLLRILRSTQSSFRSRLTFSAKEVLTFSVWSLAPELLSIHRKLQLQTLKQSSDGLESKSSPLSES